MGGAAGALSEVALATKLGRPAATMISSGGTASELSPLSALRVHACQDADQLEQWLGQVLRR